MVICFVLVFQEFLDEVVVLLCEVFWEWVYHCDFSCFFEFLVEAVNYGVSDVFC